MYNGNEKHSHYRMVNIYDDVFSARSCLYIQRIDWICAKRNRKTFRIK